MSPEGFLEPSPAALKEVLKRIEKNQFDEAISELASFKAEPNSIQTQWVSYLTGLALFGKKELEPGVQKFHSIYEYIRSSKDALPPEMFRLLGASLKKVGWYFRTKKEFDRAYAYHSIEFSYFEKYGSPLEIHDAAISLDVDSYSLNDMHLSEVWLRKSILAAEQIKEMKSRNHSLGMSYNNLAGTLYSLRRFEESETSIQKSLEYWKAYEAEAGSKESKVLWAYFGVGDVYQEWATYLKGQRADIQKKKDLSLSAYKTSFAMAEKAGLPDQGKKAIQDRIAAVTGL